MIFLAEFNLFKPSTWLSSAAEGIMGTLTSGLRTLFFWIVTVIYGLIVDIYNLFEKLCGARLLSTELISETANRIGVILGLIMFFYVVFSFIQMMIDPEKLVDKEKGAISIVKRVIIVIVMLGVSTSAFELAFGLQKKIIKENILGKIILPYSLAGNKEEQFGNILSTNLMQAFYQIDASILDEPSLPQNNTTTITDAQGVNKRDVCANLTKAFYQQIYDENKYDIGYMCLNQSIQVQRNTGFDNLNQNYGGDEIYVINFNGIVAVAAGAFVVYILLIYCFKVGVRMIQLAFLEIISPMAIISYLSPKKDNMFTKWWKMYFATYIDVFIRTAIIYFVIYLICAIFSANAMDGNFQFWETLGDITIAEQSFFTVVLILALLTFAKKAPELLKELLPAGASKLGFGLSMKDIVGLEKTAKIGAGILGGALGGTAIGLLSMSPGGIVGGLLKGGLSGLKGQGFAKTTAAAWKSNHDSIKKMRDIRANGGTWLGSRIANLQGALGMRTAADAFNLEKEKLEVENSAYKSFDGYLDAAEKRAEGQILKGEFNGNTHAQEALKHKNLAEIYRQQSSTIKRSDYALYDSNGNIIDYDDATYKDDLDKLAKQAADAESAYLKAMKAAKADFISDVLSGAKTDAPTLQNLQQAAGVVDANRKNKYDGFGDMDGATLLRGNYDTFDKTNSASKAKQADNNNELARNAQEGKRARANAGK